ncbi:MAG: pyridoxal-dependent decarboxylase [Gemmatimonadota bacterium]|nr:pyridoxal-dependent decarboxylase [Gemmatimonadota bacterium]
MAEPRETPEPDRPELGDLDPEAFRLHGHRVIDWIADYLEGLEDRPVREPTEPGETAAKVPDRPPADPEPMEAILDDLDRVVVPGMTHWAHPRFLAWFASSGSAPGVFAEALSAAFNVNGMTWLAAPAANELEEVAVDWLRQMVGLPEVFWGIVNEGASLNSVLGLAAAREAAGVEVRERGLAGREDLPRLVVYASEHAHSSIDKAAITLGFGTEGLRKIPVDDAFRMIPDALEEAIAEDKSAGRIPVCAVGTVGTTSTTSIDPIEEIAPICEREGIWLHVDAAYGGAAAVVPERRDVLAGCEQADSVIVNPHKWLFVPIDLSVLFTRRPGVLRHAFSLVPEYLRDARGETVENRMDYGITLGRRFRALKLWFVIRAFGAAGLADRVRDHLDLAGELAGWIDAHPRFERLAPTPLSVVCFRAVPPELEGDRAALNDYNERLLEAIDADGEFFLTHTRIEGRFAIRVAVNGLRTRAPHVREAWRAIRETERGIAG